MGLYHSNRKPKLDDIFYILSSRGHYPFSEVICISHHALAFQVKFIITLSSRKEIPAGIYQMFTAENWKAPKALSIADMVM